MQRRLTAAGADAERTASAVSVFMENAAAVFGERERKKPIITAVMPAWKKRDTIKGMRDTLLFSVAAATWRITETPEKEATAPAIIIPREPFISPAATVPAVTSQNPQKRAFAKGKSDKAEKIFPH